MVHGLEVLRALNARAANRPGKELKSGAPPEIAVNPVAARRHANRPWTEEELNGRQNVYKTYAEDAARPFNGKEGQREQLRP
ncbi:MAG: hypothetical protein V1861_06500 [Candidatus Micrarchaeota archaeon]